MFQGGGGGGGGSGPSGGCSGVFRGVLRVFRKCSGPVPVTGKRRLGQRLLVRLTNEDFKKAGPLENSKFSNCREIFP